MDITKQKKQIDRVKKFACSELTASRYKHSILVAETSKDLSKRFKADLSKSYLAGIGHDIAREYSSKKVLKLAEQFGINCDELQKKHPVSLLHGPVGSKILQHKKLIDDEQILGAIYYHTTGTPQFDVLGKILCVADYIEPSRSYDGVKKLRKLAQIDLDKCLYHCLLGSYNHLVSQGFKPHPLLMKTLSKLKY
ncbi:bis(5'-nucleosyl)-tetraphosphatase (symmetrical) YqeK [Proteinivorax hydrogeniformans]|uniref:bis(5'-nucleosyl)-tetraphosphatase (symmetrical) n=1 Tax=Proteinivorax hydrogeniformans TaxID=1826727 RepID=A0AAU8HWP6_9FIRM